MERLTSNKDVSDMSMVELAYNSCYAKDGRAWYRDYARDIDARELAIQLLEQYADTPNEFTCDDDFDDFMIDSMQYGTDSMLGLIALFYRNLWAMADLRERLKRYEDTGLTPEKIITLDEEYTKLSKELMGYRKIGTVEECRETIEKQRAKKPELYGDFEDGKLLCRGCGENLMDLVECGFNCCPYCGQAIDWRDIGE